MTQADTMARAVADLAAGTAAGIAARASTRIAADVLVVGGGIVGSATAWALRRRGLSVVLVERGKAGMQASSVNFGGVRQQGRKLPELPVSRRARRIWSDLARVLGSDCEFAAIGHVRLARSEADLQALQAYRDQAAPYGLELDILDGPALRRRYPWLGRDLAGGSLCAEDGHANPRLVSPRFARAAAEAGARVIEGTAVERVERAGDGFLAHAGGAAIASRWLVNCAGAWSMAIARQFGETFPLGAIYPNMIVTEPLPAFMTCCLGLYGTGFYARQVGRGSVVIGGVRASGNDSLDSCRPNTAATLKEMSDALHFIPALAGANVIRSWTGIEGAFPDGMPVVGPSTRVPGLFHAFGFGGHGFQLGPGVGEAMAELIDRGETDTDISGLLPARFDAP